MTKFISHLYTKNHRASRLQGWASGFTLIELLIAMAIFAFLLLIISTGVITVTKMYRSALSARQAQENGRRAMEEIARYVRGADKIVINSADALCVQGSTEVRFRVETGTGQLVREQITIDPNNLVNPCSGANIVPGTVQFLTPPELKVPSFEATLISPPTGGEHQSVDVKMLVATTNDADLFDPGTKQCLPGPGSQFCSTAQFETAISARGTP